MVATEKSPSATKTPAASMKSFSEKRTALTLKDPLIFRQCIHLRDVAVLLNRGSYVEQYD
jgi:hypothetical protein